MRFYPESLYDQEEFARRRLGFILQNFEDELYIPKKTAKRSVEEYLNYVDLGYVTPVKVSFVRIKLQDSFLPSLILPLGEHNHSSFPLTEGTASVGGAPV